MTHPGVGALTALAFVLIIGTPKRFATSKQVSSYLGLVPTEESSGERRHLGQISKQGSTLLRFLLVAGTHHSTSRNELWEVLHLRFRISAGGSDAAKTPQVRVLQCQPPTPYPVQVDTG